MEVTGTQTLFKTSTPVRGRYAARLGFFVCLFFNNLRQLSIEFSNYSRLVLMRHGTSMGINC